MVRDPGVPTADSRDRARANPPRIEAYRTGAETVIFDGENPLAWVASSRAITLERHA